MSNTCVILCRLRREPQHLVVSAARDESVFVNVSRGEMPKFVPPITAQCKSDSRVQKNGAGYEDRTAFYQ